MKVNEVIVEASDPTNPPQPGSKEFGASQEFIKNIILGNNRKPGQPNINPANFDDAEEYKRALWNVLRYNTGGNLTQADVEKLDLNNVDFSRGPVFIQNKIASFAPQLTQAWYNNRKAKSNAQQPPSNSKTPTVGQQATLTGKNGIKFTYQWQGNVWGLVTKNGIGKSANKAVADELFKQTGTVPPYQSTKQDNQQQNNQTQQTATSGNPSEDILINFAKASGYEGQGEPNNLNFVRYLINTINDDTKRKEFINRIRLLYSS
jgi:hypothetical protein